MKKMKKLSAAILAAVMALSCVAPAFAAEFPTGATNKVVTVTEGLNPGTYIANDGWSLEHAYTENNDLPNSRIPIANYHYSDEWDSYVFDPARYPGMQWHEDGFPMRAGFRTIVDYMGEMKYLAQEYPEICRLILIGYSNGIKDDAIRNDGQTGDGEGGIVDPSRAVPVYAMEICNKPGVMDGRPASLHQAGNHGGELDANEYCMNLAWYLCTQYGKDDEVTELLNDTRIYLLPYTNPDGNMINFRERNNINPAARTNARGVDPNRNWAYRWGSNNGSLSYMGSTHRGRGPNSEPETQAVTSLFRTDSVISEISGHTSGEIVIYAWSFMRNTTDGHPLLTKLAKEQTDLNGHTPQNGNVMYAQSGEINDYIWGSMRALGFTYEYGATQRQSYLGTPYGDPWISASYLNAAGNPKEMRTVYSTVEGSGRPEADLTAQLAYVPDEWISLGYQNLTAEEEGNGYAKDPSKPDSVGPLLNPMTPARLQAALNENPDLVKGKIFLSHVPTNAQGRGDTAAGNEIAAILKANGAVAWLVTNTASNGGYGQLRIAYGAEGLPVCGVIKGYAADLHTQSMADPSITVTLEAENKDMQSAYFQWSRQLPAYMANMNIPHDYANQLIGTIYDEAGNKIDATLEATLVIEGKIIDVDSNHQNSPNVIERSYDEQWKEIQRIRYDVEGGDYTWYMLPSKQSEYADKGWTVTAKAAGRYTETQNVKFPVDNENAIKHGKDPVIYADPLFQQVKSGVDFNLPLAFTVSTDLESLLTVGGALTINTFNRDGAAADVVGTFVKVDGKSIDIVSAGNGVYTATIPAGASTISVGTAGSEAMTATNVAVDESVPLVKRAVEQASLELTTEATLLNAGDTFGINTAFVQEVDTNVVRLTYNYNPALFEANMDESLANFADAGYTVLHSVVDAEAGQVQVTLMKADGSYGFKEFYPFTTKHVEHIALSNNQESYSDDPSNVLYTKYYVGNRTAGETPVTFEYLDVVGQDMVFTAKSDVDFAAGYQTITAVAEYVEKDDTAKVEKQSHVAMVTFTTTGTDSETEFDLIYLSNMIDAFGVTSSDADWDAKYVWMDWVGNGRIDIADIAYVAMRIK